eukprot:3941499-Rhodomonas_salina.4
MEALVIDASWTDLFLFISQERVLHTRDCDSRRCIVRGRAGAGSRAVHQVSPWSHVRRRPGASCEGLLGARQWRASSTRRRALGCRGLSMPARYCLPTHSWQAQC